MGKAKRKSFSSSFEPVNHPSEIVHSNVCGKLPSSIHRNKYICKFVDQFGRYTHVVEIKEKAYTANVVEEYKKLGHDENCFQNGVARLHFDSGSENKANGVSIRT